MIAKIKNNLFFAKLKSISRVIFDRSYSIGCWFVSPEPKFYLCEYRKPLRQTAIIGVLAIGMTFVIFLVVLIFLWAQFLLLAVFLLLINGVGFNIWLSIVILIGGSIIGAIHDLSFTTEGSRVYCNNGRYDDCPRARDVDKQCTKITGLPLQWDFAVQRYLGSRQWLMCVYHNHHWLFRIRFTTWTKYVCD